MLIPGIDSRLACGFNYDCVFHSSNADYPNLVGCCPVTGSTTECHFLTTCYDAQQVEATPSLGSMTTDPFVTLCTASDNVYCHTWTWPDLSMRDYACTYIRSPAIESLQTVGSLTDVTIDADQITETVSISWVGDGVVAAMATVSTSVDSSATSATATSTSGPDKQDDHESDGDGGSTPVGAIVGGVVGGVVGLGLIIAGVIFYRVRRRKNTSSPSHAAVPKDPGVVGPAAFELHGKNEWHEMDGSRSVVAELPARGPRHELE